MNNMTTGKERRRFARLDLALTVSYMVMDGSAQIDHDPVQGLTADISVGGIRLMTPAPLPLGTNLELNIFLGEDENPVKTSGLVVWQQKLSPTSYETGVEITRVEDSDRKRFMSFIFNQMSKIVGGEE